LFSKEQSAFLKLCLILGLPEPEIIAQHNLGLGKAKTSQF
jgi:hypothetical protein